MRRSRRQMFAEERLHCFVEIKPVLFVVKSVSFIRFDHVLNIDPALLEGLNNLIRLVDVNPWIFCSLRHEKRRFDLIGIQGG